MTDERSYQVGVQANYKPDSDFEVYGKITAETDFHGDEKAKAEIGFIKKF